MISMPYFPGHHRHLRVTMPTNTIQMVMKRNVGIKNEQYKLLPMRIFDLSKMTNPLLYKQDKTTWHIPINESGNNAYTPEEFATVCKECASYTTDLFLNRLCVKFSDKYCGEYGFINENGKPAIAYFPIYHIRSMALDVQIWPDKLTQAKIHFEISPWYKGTTPLFTPIDIHHTFQDADLKNISLMKNQIFDFDTNASTCVPDSEHAFYDLNYARNLIDIFSVTCLEIDILRHDASFITADVWKRLTVPDEQRLA